MINWNEFEWAVMYPSGSRVALGGFVRGKSSASERGLTLSKAKGLGC